MLPARGKLNGKSSNNKTTFNMKHLISTNSLSENNS